MLTAHGATHPGRVRKNNEDSLYADPALGLFVVADGMGGHNAGEVASKLAIETIKNFLAMSQDGDDFTWPYGLDPALSFHANRLMTAVKLANRRVFKVGESRDEYTGLGTTVVAALVDEGHLIFSGVGDSRIYVWNGDRLDQITQDDSWAATVLGRDHRDKKGKDKEDPSLATHPLRHVLTNVLGARETLEMDVSERDFAGQDVVLLCSDGLHGALDDDAIAQVLASKSSATAMADQLVALALERDGNDNITALVVRAGS
jgi:serine/threonine protein phosphatase PrpC